MKAAADPMLPWAALQRHHDARGLLAPGEHELERSTEGWGPHAGCWSPCFASGFFVGVLIIWDPDSGPH